MSKAKAESEKNILSKIYSWTFGNIIFRNIILIGLFLLLLLFLTFKWLDFYTDHGEELIMPEYVGMDVKKASSEAREKSFKIVVSDSIHIVGKDGGIILKQNPEKGDLVKENRKVYTTITKHLADLIPLGRLPDLYGKNYSRKKYELENSFEINCKIVGRRFDPGAEDHILAVIYKGDTIVSAVSRKEDIKIEKGSQLGFIISEKGGGIVPVPDLICMTTDAALFILESYGLVLGSELSDGSVGTGELAYIYRQFPSPGSQNLVQGSTVDIFITKMQPPNCIEEEDEEE